MKLFKIILSLFTFLLIATASQAQTDEENEWILSQANLAELEQLKLKHRIESLEREQRIAEYLKSHKRPLADDDVILYDIDRDGNPIYLHSLSNHFGVKTVKANYLHTGGSLGLTIDGQGLKTGVWDQGWVMPNHDAFISNDPNNPGSRVSLGESNAGNPSTYHPTAVTSAIIAQSNLNYYGQTIEGTANKASVISYSSAGVNGSNELINAITSPTPLSFSNHSMEYAGNWLDEILYLQPAHSAFCANGNSILNPISNHKNAITVGWCENSAPPIVPDQNIYSQVVSYSEVPIPCSFGDDYVMKGPNIQNASNIPDLGYAYKYDDVDPYDWDKRGSSNPSNWVDWLGRMNITNDIVVSLNLDIDHAQVGDLKIYLVCPDNDGAIEVSLNNGGDEANYDDSYFSNIFPNDVTKSVAPFSKTAYRFQGLVNQGPANIPSAYQSIIPTSSITGCKIKGEWKVYVIDEHLDQITGKFNRAKLSFAKPHIQTDLKVRPHLSAPGDVVTATYDPAVPTATDKVGGANGSSFSSPLANGGGMLLQEHYSNLNSNFMLSPTLKALMIHDARDAGLIGPDFAFGYGILDLDKSARTISNDGGSTRIFEKQLANSGTYNFTFDSDGSPIVATLCWLDPAHQNGDLINDLQLEIIGPSLTHLPYVLTSANVNDPASTGYNSVDEVEKVEILHPEPGTYTVKVSHLGTLVDNNSMLHPSNYSLIISGISDCSASNSNINISTDLQYYQIQWEYASQQLTASNTLKYLSKARYVAGEEVEFTGDFDAIAGCELDGLIRSCAQNSSSSNKTYNPIHRDAIIFDNKKSEPSSKPKFRNQVKVYPNPSKGLYKLETEGLGKGQLQIMNLYGQPIYERSFEENELVEIDIQNQPSGHYFLHIKTAGNNQTLKITKL